MFGRQLENQSSHEVWLLVWVFFIALSVACVSQSVASTPSQADATCVSELGKGAFAQEDLEFGQTGYVCSCKSAFPWNDDHTACTYRSPAGANTASTSNGVSSTSAIAEKHYQLAREADLRNDHTTAVKEYRKAVDQGHTLATYMLAVQYQLGQGVPRSYNNAIRWYRVAASRGDIDANHSLGQLYESGKGTRQDSVRAARLVADSLRAGSSIAARDVVKNASQYSKQFRLELQRILQIEGTYSGKIDGAFGPQTTKAIKQLAGQ